MMLDNPEDEDIEEAEGIEETPAVKRYLQRVKAVFGDIEEKEKKKDGNR